VNIQEQASRATEWDDSFEESLQTVASFGYDFSSQWLTHNELESTVRVKVLRTNGIWAVYSRHCNNTHILWDALYSIYPSGKNAEGLIAQILGVESDDSDLVSTCHAQLKNLVSQLLVEVDNCIGFSVVTEIQIKESGVVIACLNQLGRAIRASNLKRDLLENQVEEGVKALVEAFKAKAQKN